MVHSAISTDGLRKVYRSAMGRRDIVALDGLDLRVEPGEVFGLLGPNVAGKTTTVKILLDLTRPSSGQARILGVSTSRPDSRRPVGYLPEGHRFPGYLTARSTLSIFGRMSGLDTARLRRRSGELLERVGLADWADIRVKKFSKGMTQRLGLAAALLHDPSVLMLDEPTDGVDPVGRREIRDLLAEEARAGRAILLNSHLLSEIELTCTRVAILRRGKVVAQGRIDDLTRRQSVYRLVAEPAGEMLATEIRSTGAAVEGEGRTLLLSVRDAEHLNQILDLVRRRGALVEELSPVRSSLEDVFVGLVRTGDAAEEDRS
jgi:ABC-2 type transport system ATP-binding protein